MTANNWTPLEGGCVNIVAFKDNIVRRKLTSVSPAIHKLLKHLEARNLAGVPRLIDWDENYEYLTYIPGKPIFRPWCDAIKSDRFITSVGKWLKDYHHVIADFRLQGDVRFNWGVKSPEPEMIVCHGDLGPWNCIQLNGEFKGIIDWDLAHYGYAIDDVAEFAFTFIPICPYSSETIAHISDLDKLKRLTVFCEAYQKIQPDEILAHIPIYLTRMNADLRKQASLGIEPFVSFVDRGIADKLDEDKVWIESYWLGHQH
ncbi:MAG: aminoglycoside phosphotransferase family protein [Pleurocapsa sp. MO_226.B13]|nr:aminoglycoside phosphotransferase family protein [Pleurocapsa sp. MO_226.B13]